MPAKGTRKIRVVRAFLLRGERQEPGALLELETGSARELVAAGKAELVGDPPPAPAELMTTKDSPLVGGRKKGTTDV